MSKKEEKLTRKIDKLISKIYGPIKINRNEKIRLKVKLKKLQTKRDAILFKELDDCIMETCKEIIMYLTKKERKDKLDMLNKINKKSGENERKD